MRKNGTILLLAVLAGLAGCETTLDDQVEAFEKFVSKGQVGYSPDFYLAKRNILGEWENVALIYGYADDHEVCQDLAELYVQKYPMDEYTCLQANRT
jgi:hypothetical protein